MSTLATSNAIMLSQGELRISVLPTYLSYDSYWPVRKVPTKSTPHFVSYHPEAKVSCCHGYNDAKCVIVKVYTVVISEDKVCKALPKISTAGEEAITLDPVDRGTVHCNTDISLSAPYR